MKKISTFKGLILFIAAIICIVKTASAQLPCNTDDHYRRLLQQYPQLADYQEQFEAQIKDAIASRVSSIPDTITYDIPLVVHVIHDYGVENVSDNVIYQAALDWATIYMEQNADTVDVIPPFKAYIGNARIRLHLATIDPNGKPTKGVVRYNSYLTMTADDHAKFGQWPQNEYVNIWLINTFGAAETGAAAYAYVPGTAVFQPYYDGVICLSSYTDYAKTIPHELGHVLNLEHPWGNTNNPGVACGDDGVADTPPTKGHNPVGCTPAALYDTACASTYVGYPDTVNAQNIMDYTYCQRMFTKGQVTRMRTALRSTTAGRNNLFSVANLAATGALFPMPDLPPVADYVVGKAIGGSISDARTYFLTFNNTSSFTFKNASWNDTVSSVLWKFTNGATLSTSTVTSTVDNQFSVPGWVTVTLIANSNAGSDTLVNTQTVYAADTTPAGTLGYSQKFASATDITNWPMFNFYNNQFKWQFYNGAGFDDNTCVRYRSFDTSNKRTGSPVGDHDDFYTPAFNLNSTQDSLFLNFYTAAASISTSGLGFGVTAKGDSLEIDASTTGGERWTKLVAYHGSDLANNGVKSGEFVPTTTAQWKARALSIPATYRTGNTFFRFRYYPGNTGNNLYLDNLSLSQWTAGVQQVLSASDQIFSIFPNPATSDFNLVFKTGNDGMVSYSIKDITGKLVYAHKTVLASNSIGQETVSRSVIPAAGMYFVTATIDGVTMTQKLVVY